MYCCIKSFQSLSPLLNHKKLPHFLKIKLMLWRLGKIIDLKLKICAMERKMMNFS